MGDLIPLLGDGLLTTDSDYHRRARRIMLPAFHREQIAATAGSCPRRWSAPWSRGARASASTSTPGRAGWRCAWRCGLCSGSTPDAAMSQMAERSNGRSASGVAHTPRRCFADLRSPYRLMIHARAWLDAVIFAEIDRRLASGERGFDLLSLLMDATDEDGSRLSKQELRDQVMTLLFAGPRHDHLDGRAACVHTNAAAASHRARLTLTRFGPSDRGMRFASPSCENPRRGYGAGEKFVKQAEADLPELEWIERKRFRAQFTKQDFERIEERERVEKRKRSKEQAALEFQGEERERQPLQRRLSAVSFSIVA